MTAGAHRILGLGNGEGRLRANPWPTLAHPRALSGRPLPAERP